MIKRKKKNKDFIKINKSFVEFKRQYILKFYVFLN